MNNEQTQQDRSTTIYNLYTNRLYLDRSTIQCYLDVSVINSTKINFRINLTENGKYTTSTASLYLIDMISTISVLRETIEAAKEITQESVTLSFIQTNAEKKQAHMTFTCNANGIWALIMAIPGMPNVTFEFNGIPGTNISFKANTMSVAKRSTSHLLAWLKLLENQLFTIVSLHASDGRKELPPRGTTTNIS